jgi:hypothetical protein
MTIPDITVLDFEQKKFLKLLNDAHYDSGRNLREIGDLCIVDHSYVWRVLRGERRPRRDILIALCTKGWGLDLYDTDVILKTGGYKTIMDWQKAGWD